MKKTKPIDRPFVESFAEKAGILKRAKDKVPRMYYLCGAISNDPHAQLKFDLAEIYLKASGNQVINPMHLSPVGTPWHEAMSTDLEILVSMKKIYMELLKLSNKLDVGKIYYPSVALIDPMSRRIDSRGMTLEVEFASDILPIIQLSTRWDEILFQALKEYQPKDGWEWVDGVKKNGDDYELC